MEENLKKLEAFKESISAFKPLSLKEAKVLYNELLNEKNETIREEKRQALICGLLNEVYKQIISSNLIRFFEPTYDIEDVIDSFVEILIKKIDEGILLKDFTLSEIFDIGFYNMVSESIISNNTGTYETINLDINIFVDLLLEFIKYKNNNKVATFMNFLDEYQGVYKRIIPCFKLRSDIYIIENIFEKIYQSFLADEDEIVNMPKIKIKKVVYLLLHCGLNSINVTLDGVLYEDMAERIDHKVLCDELCHLVLRNRRISEQQLMILKKYYLEGKTLNETSEELGLSQNKTVIERTQAIYKLRTSPSLRKYLNTTKFLKC